MPHPQDEKIVLPGGAGLVGQNLVARLRARGYRHMVVLDKHAANLEILRQTQPGLVVEHADLSQPGGWEHHVDGASVVVMLQAQIGSPRPDDFARNTLDSTRYLLEVIRRQQTRPYLVHISSSVVHSQADDDYTRSKRDQERMVLDSGLAGPVLRPTLMFGWFDRKHLGWLSRFMQRVPIFPVPGDGRFIRQPLYVRDFCDVIVACIERRIPRGCYDITGQERIDYIDILREIRRATGAHTAIVRIPYRLFHALLWTWGKLDRDPPFTTQQLEALVARDEFDVIDWPGLFGVRATPFRTAIEETFNHPQYSQIVLEF